MQENISMGVNVYMALCIVSLVGLVFMGVLYSKLKDTLSLYKDENTKLGDAHTFQIKEKNDLRV